MPIRIKNDQTERLVRKLAELTGETLTDAVRVAVAASYDRLLRVQSRYAARNGLCSRRSAPMRSWGYDESGMPMR